jgi:hypothetical protein
VARKVHPRAARTVARVNDLEGALLFAGIPLAVLAVVFVLVFRTTPKPIREPITKPIMDDDPADHGKS